MGSHAAAQAAPSARLHRPTPAPATGPAPTLSVEITGELLHDAQMRVEPCTQRACVSLQLAQAHDEHQCVHAVVWFGDGREAVFEAQDRAAELLQGRRVRVTGEGLSTRWERGTLVFNVGVVRRVELAFGTQP